jgi:uncharacterized damage-inducible protein DinB
MTLQEMFERAESSRQQILDAADKMDAASFVERRPGVFSVRDLLAHLMDAEDFWIGSVVLGGEHLKFTPERYSDVKALKTDWDKVRERTRTVFATLSQELLGQTRSARGETGVTFEVDRILWHFLAHEIHHRAQVCMLMREHGFEPPVVDLL